MNTSSRFVIAVHILAGLSVSTKTQKSECVKSETIAWSVNTNPVFIRRILSALRKAGLITSKPGPDGGSQLARNPEQITLLEVYQAVEDGSLFHLHYSEPNPNCPVGMNIVSVLAEFLGHAEEAMKNSLAGFTIEDVRMGIMACMQLPPS